MKEKSIRFYAQEVRATLAGTKTQTRRVVKPWKPRISASPKAVPDDVAYLPDFTCYRSTCPYGQPGSKLWVRETWAQFGQGAIYRATSDYRPPGAGMWRPSIHMPRWASRITLEITGVRVERLQDISEADALAEGIRKQRVGQWYSTAGLGGAGTTARAAYALLWNKINGPGSWDDNPWVWVVEFKRLEGAA